MEILNVGPMELLLILFLAFVVMGPEGMVDAAGKLGKTIRKIINSSIWKEITGSYRDLSDFSEEIIRNTGLEESINEINELNNTVVEFDKSNTTKNREANNIAELEENKSSDPQVDSSRSEHMLNWESENQIHSPDMEN